MIQLMSLVSFLSVKSTLGEETANLRYEPPPRLQSIQNKYDGVHSRKGCNGIEELPLGRTNTTTRLQALRWHRLILLRGHKTFSFQDGDGKGGLGRLRGAQHRRSSGGCTVQNIHIFQPQNVGQDSWVHFWPSLSTWLLRTSGGPGSLVTLDPMGNQHGIVIRVTG